MKVFFLVASATAEWLNDELTYEENRDDQFDDPFRNSWSSSEDDSKYFSEEDYDSYNYDSYGSMEYDPDVKYDSVRGTPSKPRERGDEICAETVHVEQVANPSNMKIYPKSYQNITCGLQHIRTNPHTSHIQYCRPHHPNSGNGCQTLFKNIHVFKSEGGCWKHLLNFSVPDGCQCNYQRAGLYRSKKRT